jgi:hypothetical protein
MKIDDEGISGILIADSDWGPGAEDSGLEDE